MTPGRLSLRALNRAALHRQLLLDRAPLTALDAVGHLAGLQAQAPLAPYVGLWTRLAGFRHEELKELITERAVLRAHLMRNTVHLVDAGDYVRFRPLYQPLLARHLAGNFGKNLIGVDLAELAAVAADLLGETPLTRVELGARLAPRWPDHDPASLAYAASHLLPLVQVPPRGLWGEPNHRAAFMLADAWLSAGPGPGLLFAVDHARAARAALPGRLRPGQRGRRPGLVRADPAARGDRAPRHRLRAFTGPDGAELLDLPDAPRPDPDVPAPPRFLPEYDNLLLSYAERSRVIPHRRPVPLPPGHGATGGTLLVDGLWQADWKISQGVLEIEPFISLGPADRDAVAAEGERLLGFAAPAIAVRDVRFVPVRSG